MDRLKRPTSICRWRFCTLVYSVNLRSFALCWAWWVWRKWWTEGKSVKFEESSLRIVFRLHRLTNSHSNSILPLYYISGRYVTEMEVEDRVSEMENTRSELMDRLEYQMSLNPHPHNSKKQKPKKEKRTEETKSQSPLITEWGKSFLIRRLDTYLLQLHIETIWWCLN